VGRAGGFNGESPEIGRGGGGVPLHQSNPGRERRVILDYRGRDYTVLGFILIRNTALKGQ
jgi:hypothetical protein